MVAGKRRAHVTLHSEGQRFGFEGEVLHENRPNTNKEKKYKGDKNCSPGNFLRCGGQRGTGKRRSRGSGARLMSLWGELLKLDSRRLVVVSSIRGQEKILKRNRKIFKIKRTSRNSRGVGGAATIKSNPR